MFSRKIKFVIFACSPAKVGAAHCRLSDCGLTHRCFLEIFGFWLYWGLALCLSFRAGIYGTKTDMFSRKIKFVIFDCSPAKIGAAHYRTFFARTKKVPKKYAEGVRTLSTPGDAVKLRLRFAPQVLRRYLNFHSMWKRKIRSFSLPLSDSGLTHQCFLKSVVFCYIGIWFYI